MDERPNPPPTAPPPLADAQPTAPPDAASPMVGDVACLTCGYHLAGLPEAGVCPECGTSVGTSLRPRLLRRAGLGALRRLRCGLLLLMLASVALAVGAVLLAVSLRAPGMGPEIVVEFLALVMIGTWVLSSVGWWLATCPCPDLEPPRRMWLVRLLGWSSLAQWVGMFAGALLFAYERARPYDESLATTVLSVVFGAGVFAAALTLFLGPWRIHQVCALLPNAALRRTWRRVFCGVVVGAGACLLTFGVMQVSFWPAGILGLVVGCYLLVLWTAWIASLAALDAAVAVEVTHARHGYPCDDGGSA